MAFNDEYINRKEAILAVTHDGCTANVVGVLYHLPAADVAPKSEEGAECPTCHGTGRIGTTDWLTKNISKKKLAEEKAKAIAEHEQHIKSEVAREILREARQALLNMVLANSMGETYDIEKRFAEIEKKYTEPDAE